MKKRLTIFSVVAGLVVFMAFSGGPPDGRTGAPGEGTCAGCHGNLNVSGGSISMVVPATFAPGETLDVAIGLERSGQNRWGFEATVLDTSDNFVGELIASDAVRTQLSTGNNRTYVKHTRSGTDNGTANQAPGWTFQWVAPQTAPTRVVFYAAGNAADGGGSTGSDFIYTASQASDQATTGVNDFIAGLPDGFALKPNYPNPFNPQTVIPFELAEAGEVELTILDMRGREVAQLARGMYNAGEHKIRWHADNAAAGVYFARLRQGSIIKQQRMLLLK